MEDVEDEEYTAPGELTLVVRRDLSVMRTIKGIPLKLQVILCTFIEAQSQEVEPKRCNLF